MKFNGYTDAKDYHWRTLVSYLLDPKCWCCGTQWDRWRLHYLYDWYDGPFWQLEIGPFWVAVGAPFDRL